MLAAPLSLEMSHGGTRGKPLPAALLKRWMGAYRDLVHEHLQLLTDLDAAIGDADHGVNMQRGVDRVARELEGPAVGDVAALFRQISAGFTASIGGASGPLYGAFFLHAASVAPKKQELSYADFGICLQAGLQGVVGLGRAEAGDKTMVDALAPAVAAFRASLRNKTKGENPLEKAAHAARAAAVATIPLQARKGRASYLGPRSIGHQDPGATSAWLLFQALADVVPPSGEPIKARGKR